VLRKRKKKRKKKLTSQQYQWVTKIPHVARSWYPSPLVSSTPPLISSTPPLISSTPPLISSTPPLVSTPKRAGPKKKESSMKALATTVRSTKYNKAAKGWSNAGDREGINVLKSMLEKIMHDMGTDETDGEDADGEGTNTREGRAIYL
jgi:hypothetical protein